jgi:hypothetical protein
MPGRDVHCSGNMGDIGLAERRERDAVLQVFKDQVTAPPFPTDFDARHGMVSLG